LLEHSPHHLKVIQGLTPAADADTEGEEMAKGEKRASLLLKSVNERKKSFITF
jgi:hypothetical protein